MSTLLLLFGSAPVVPGVVVTEPDPNETRWTLGYGGATWDGRVGAGFNLALASVLLNNAIPVGYGVSATLDASVWRGGEEAALFSPAVAWDSANGGHSAGRFTLAIGAGSTAALEPGVYRLQVGVTESGVRSLAYDGTLEITDAPGTVAPSRYWCSEDDMLLYSDQIRSLKGKDTTGFGGQRARATADVAYEIGKRYQPRPGYTKVRQPTYDATQGFDQTTSASPPTKAVIEGAIASGGIILDVKLREIVARRAIAIVLGRVFGNTAYAAEAKAQMEMAEDLFCGHNGCEMFQAQIDADLDGTPDYLIDIDCIILPAGAAP